MPKLLSLVRSKAVPTIFALVVATYSDAAYSQQTESLDEPIGDHTGGNVATVSDTPEYVVPDLPPRKPPDPDQKLPFIVVKPTLVLIGDWTGFGQDETHIDQVGRQEDTFQIRSMRLSFSGSIGGSYRVIYQLAGEYKGFATDADRDWQLTDVSLTFPLGERTKLAIGKLKETFSYEMVGDSANLAQSERVLNPFFVSRNFGFRLTQVFGADKRATVSLGAYHDAWDFYSNTDRGWDATARATGLLWALPDRQQYLHVGVSYRHAAVDETTRYRGRAETNVGDYVIDTGDFEARSADHFGTEALLNIGSVSFLGEYVWARVNSPLHDNPIFRGWYVTASWVLTGEARPYDRNVGYARRIIPKGRWGAPELVARYSSVDLNDNDISGGRFNKTMVGLNWWATTRWKFSVNWGHSWLYRFDQRGESDVILTRIQWVL